MTETTTKQAGNETPHIFITILLGGLALALLVVIVVGIFTIARNWEDQNISWNHKAGTFTVESSKWWGLFDKSTTYKHSSSMGWCKIDAEGKAHSLRDIDETKANIKDAADGKNIETNVIQSQIPRPQK